MTWAWQAQVHSEISACRIMCQCTTSPFTCLYVNDSVMRFRSFSRKRNINTLVTVTVTPYSTNWRYTQPRASPTNLSVVRLPCDSPVKPDHILMVKSQPTDNTSLPRASATQPLTRRRWPCNTAILHSHSHQSYDTICAYLMCAPKLTDSQA